VTFLADDQVRVAELVPEIPECSCFLISAFEMSVVAASGRNDTREHRQMSGVRFVKSRDQRVDDSQRPFVRNHEARPPFTSGCRPVLVGDSFERSNDGRADRDDAMAVTSGRVDPFRRFGRDTIQLLVRRFVILEAADSRVQYDRCDLNAG
jgi:hypothetical protein